MNPRSKPNLVLLHGGGVGPWMWSRQVEYFSERYRVLTPVLPGHSTSAPGEFTTQVSAAESVNKQLDGVHGALTVAGFSLGGQTALQFAESYPERVGRLIVVSSVVRPVAIAGAMSVVAGAAAPLAHNERFARAQAKQMYITDDQFDAYFDLSRHISRASITNLTRANFTFRVGDSVLTDNRPVLLMYGDREPRMLKSGMAWLADRLPRSTTRVFPRSGHGLPLQRPDDVNSAIDGWLASNPLTP